MGKAHIIVNNATKNQTAQRELKVWEVQLRWFQALSPTETQIPQMAGTEYVSIATPRAWLRTYQYHWSCRVKIFLKGNLKFILTKNLSLVLKIGGHF